ncbi:DUF7144 family membrane protein [Nocardioides sp. Soil805]|uniref:DUF7144 family membrane protein n=1 Tax=Nocardioides sp. Soil805 TaxID=1736416 RepID=UPI00070273B6|nr:hypothetical protein [Nocardioides sp. Soil805]KRF37422.1 hypothetical protein ASG94_08855 [Nocardioides sp. Soil805]
MTDRNAGVTTPPASAAGQRRASSGEDYVDDGPTMWVGWIAFASMMMMLLGALHAMQGLVGLFQDEYYLVGKNDLVVHVDYTTWGWVHLIAGILLAVAGGALLAGQMWARAIGVLFAFGSAILNVAFLSAYPIWSTIMIVVDVLVIWAITVHGREMRDARGWNA